VNTAAFLATLRGRDIQVWAEGGQLRCSAPPGTLSTEFRDELRQRKSDILKFLDTAQSLARQQRAIIPLQPRGTRTPVFAVAGHNGDVFCYRTLVQYLGDDQPFFGLQPPGLDGQSQPLTCIEDLAAYFAAQIKAFQPEGPYIIAGYCAGGATAFELAQQLLRAGSTVKVLALFGAPYATAYQFRSQMRLRFETQWARVSGHVRALASLSGAQRRAYILEKLKLILPRSDAESKINPATAGQKSKISPEVLAQRIKVQRATFVALARYNPSHFAGRLLLLLPCKAWAHSSRKPLRWRSVAEHVEEHYGPDDCHTDVMLLEPHAAVFAKLFDRSVMYGKDRNRESQRDSATKPRVARNELPWD
jgi:thioesterase domain-containing protein